MSTVNDTQSRKWLITINNPADYGFTHDMIKQELEKIKSCVYWCLSDEIGENGTYHTHVFVSCSSAVRFSTMKKKFPVAHLDLCNGTSQQNRDYVFKEGEHAKGKKRDTRIEGTQEEWGEIPVERQGKRNDLDDLYDMIKSGMSDYEIMTVSPRYMFNMDKVARAREIMIQEKYKNTWRDLEVTYVFGATGSGKTRGIMEQYGYANVYRITDYLHPFDGYAGQDVVMFEEFRSSLRIGDMLKYLDGYPVELPCRYNNKVACFTKVYIVTNIALESQYPEVQHDEEMTWRAFLRRIHKVRIYDGITTREADIRTYLEGFRSVDAVGDQMEIPFTSCG